MLGNRSIDQSHRGKECETMISIFAGARLPARHFSLLVHDHGKVRHDGLDATDLTMPALQLGRQCEGGSDQSLGRSDAGERLDVCAHDLQRWRRSGPQALEAEFGVKELP